MRLYLLFVLLCCVLPVSAQITNIQNGQSITNGTRISNVVGAGGGSGLLSKLVSHYTMDEAEGATRSDSHGPNHLDTLVGTPGQVAGKLGNAGEVDPNSESMRQTSPSGFAVPAGGVLTISGWFYPTISIANDASVVGLYTTYPSSFVWSLQTVTTGGNQFKFYLRANSTDYSVTSGAGTIALTTWVHYICEIDDAAKEIRIRLNNGTPVVQAYSGTPASSTPAFNVGYVGEGAAARGRHDEIAIFDEALTSQEVADLYGSGTPPAYPY